MSENTPHLRITDLQIDDRPREKALRYGIKKLSDSELIAIIFGMGLPGLSALDMSKLMLDEVKGSLTAIASIPIRDLVRRFKGVGEAKAISLAAAFELGERVRAELDRGDSGERIMSSKDAYNAIRSDIQLISHEEFWVILMRHNHQIVSKELISRGGTAATVVDMKLIMRAAICNNAATCMILCHNHPSGNLNPSAEDDKLTRKAVESARMLDLRVLDHIIVGAGGYYSYADNGRL